MQRRGNAAADGRGVAAGLVDKLQRADETVLAAQLARQVAADAEDGVAQRLVAEAPQQIRDVLHLIGLGKLAGVADHQRAGAGLHRLAGGARHLPDGHRLGDAPAAAEVAEAGAGRMAQVVDVELAVNIGAEIGLQIESLDLGHGADKGLAVGNDPVVGLAPDLERIARAHLGGHDRHHLADTGRNEADAPGEVETRGQAGGQRLTREPDDVVEVLAEEDRDRPRALRQSGRHRAQHGGQGIRAHRGADQVGTRHRRSHGRAVARGDAVHAPHLQHGRRAGRQIVLDHHPVAMPLLQGGDDGGGGVDEEDLVAGAREERADERAADIAGAEVDDCGFCVHGGGQGSGRRTRRSGVTRMPTLSRALSVTLSPSSKAKD